MSDPATKQDLDHAIGAIGEELRGEMKGLREELRSEMKSLGEELRGEMKAMEARLRNDIGSDMRAMEDRLTRAISTEVAHVANVMLERISDLVKVVEEKYQDLPAQQNKLRRDLDEHVSNFGMHKQPAAPVPKRTRRTRSR